MITGIVIPMVKIVLVLAAIKIVKDWLTPRKPAPEDESAAESIEVP